jgi:hypothetical protein
MKLQFIVVHNASFFLLSSLRVQHSAVIMFNMNIFMLRVESQRAREPGSRE